MTIFMGFFDAKWLKECCENKTFKFIKKLIKKIKRFQRLIFQFDLYNFFINY